MPRDARLVNVDPVDDVDVRCAAPLTGKEIVVIGSNKHEVVKVKEIPFTSDEEFAKNADALA